MKEHHLFALRLTIMFGENDIWRHQNIAHELVERTRKATLDIAFVFHGQEGYGASFVIHSTSGEAFNDNLPIGIVIIDTEEKILAFIPQIEEMLTEGTISLEPCQLIRHHRT